MNMKKLWAVPLALVLTSSVAVAADDDFKWEINTLVDFASDYVYRGKNLYDGISVQPTEEVVLDMGEYGAVIGAAWQHFSAEGNDRYGRDKFTQLNFTLGYEYSIDILTLGVVHEWKVYPRDSDNIDDTAEFIFSASLDVPSNPTLTYFKDYRETYINLFELSFSHRFDIQCGCGCQNKCGCDNGFNFTPAVVFGFASNADHEYRDDSGLMYIGTSISSQLKMGEVQVIPTVAYNFKVDKETENEFWIKLGFGYGWL